MYVSTTYTYSKQQYTTTTEIFTQNTVFNTNNKRSLVWKWNTRIFESICSHTVFRLTIHYENKENIEGVGNIVLYCKDNNILQVWLQAHIYTNRHVYEYIYQVLLSLDAKFIFENGSLHSFKHVGENVINYSSIYLTEDSCHSFT